MTLDEDWDRFVAANPLGHHEQTSANAMIRSMYHFDCARVKVKHAGRVAGGVQLLIKKTPIGRIGLVLRGPLADQDDVSTMEDIVSELDRLARRQRLISVVVETLPPQRTAREALLSRGFVPTESWRGVNYVAQRRIDMSDDEILKTMTKKGRYSTRLAMRNDVLAREVGPDSITAFYGLYTMTAEHQDFPALPGDYLKYVMNLFSSTGRMRLFLAFVDGKPVAGVYNTIIGDHMLYSWGGMDRGDIARRSMANYLLHFRAMLLARDLGCRIYDMGVISPDDEYGLTHFKTSVAPERVRWPTPMRKWYGLLAGLRSAMSQAAWSSDFLRRNVNRLTWRLGLRQPQPW